MPDRMTDDPSPSYAELFQQREDARAQVERLRARVAELEATPVDWDAQRRRADELEAAAERLRAELAEARGERVAGQLARIGDWEEIGSYVRTIEAELATERASVAEYQRQIGYLRDDVTRAEAERDMLRETLAESDLGAQVLAQWEAIAAADADRDRLEAERDAALATLARTRTTWSEWYGRLGGAFPPAMVQEMGAALDASSSTESTDHANNHASSHGGEHGAPKMRPVSVESPGNDGFRYEATSESPQGRPMKLTLSMDPSDPLCRRLMVDGHQVGLITNNHNGWTAGLWPVADRRPQYPFGGETINQAYLADLRYALRRRLDQGGPWWTADAPESPQEDV